MKAALVIIGDEILNGSTIDTNAQFLAQVLDSQGILLMRKLTVRDRAPEITHALAQAAQGTDLIITTGGLGPTNDDITKQTITQCLDDELVMDDQVLAHVESFFARRHKPMLESNRRQALVPRRAEVLHNDLGTAPGLWCTWGQKAVVVLPGVPYEMKHIVEHRLLPKLQGLQEAKPIQHRYIHTVGVGESVIANTIAQIEADLPPTIGLAYLPSPGIVKLRLTGLAHGGDDMGQSLADFSRQIADKLGDIVFSTEANDSLPKAIGRLMAQTGKRMGTVESCTSGYLAHMITQIPGSSSYYDGSLVTYSYALKEKMLGVKHATLAQYGAVSQETIHEMAQGGLQALDVDYVLATSGIAGPSGGLPNKPVGTVWIAVADRQGVWPKKFQFNADRVRNIHLTAVMALDMLRRRLMGLA
ncbi:MAG: competence/damage-inducible protein A [Bacteroidetes bacterium]|jgi:nicotinamide-nucleotide amidase|nr:competence/damage-inducible protein A [Bacteroidota bacterium]